MWDAIPMELMTLSFETQSLAMSLRIFEEVSHGDSGSIAL